MSPHWSYGGGELRKKPPVPLVPLIDLDYTQGPKVSPHPLSAAEVVALGLPAPNVLYGCQDVATPLVDAVGGVDLTQSAGTGLALMGQRATGIWYNNDFTGAQKKAIEGQDGTTSRWAAANNTLLDKVAQSFAWYVEFRTDNHLMATGNRGILGKYASSRGYSAHLSNTGALTFVVGDGTAQTVTYTNALLHDGGWHRALFVVDRTAGKIQIFTDLGNSALTTITRPGSYASTGIFGLFYESTTYYSLGGQLALVIGWDGASAVGMGQADFDKLNQHALDPNAVPMPATHTNQYSDVIGYTAGFGLHLADWSLNVLPWGWNPGINKGAGGLGVGIWAAASGIITESELFTTTWAAVGGAVASKAWADLNDSPRGMREACKLTSGGAGSYIWINSTTVAANIYTIDVFVKRHSSMGADVNCFLECYNNTGAAIVQTDPFVATAEWQRIVMRVPLTQVGQVSTHWRIGFTDAAGSISLFRATPVRYELQTPIKARGAVGTHTLTLQRFTGAAGQYAKADRGEVDLTVCTLVDSRAVRYLFSMSGPGAAYLQNMHRAYISWAAGTPPLIREYSSCYNDSGVAVWNTNPALPVFNVVNQEMRFQQRWDTTKVLRTRRYGEHVVNQKAAIQDRSLAQGVWPTSDSINWVTPGANYAATAGSQLNGYLCKFRVYGEENR